MRFATKLAVFFLPLLAVVAFELFILPIDYFTFRVWEALTVHSFRPADGPFYPNHRVVKDESADMLGVKDPAPKRLTWETDRYGFRNATVAEEPARYDIVVVGDSNIVGSYLDQDDTLASVLARKCGCNVYNYGGASKRQLFGDPRFIEAPPRAFVVETRSGEFYIAGIGDWNELAPGTVNYTHWLPAPLAELADRMLKQNMLQYWRSRLKLQLRAEGGDVGIEFSVEDRVPRMVRQILAMKEEAERRGSDFVFYPMPIADRSLDAGMPELRWKGVKTLFYPPTAEFPHGVDLEQYYQEHDTHWREESVVRTADEILALLGWPSKD